MYTRNSIVKMLHFLKDSIWQHAWHSNVNKQYHYLSANLSMDFSKEYSTPNNNFILLSTIYDYSRIIYVTLTYKQLSSFWTEELSS